jgi:ankyrin repeat protein
MFKAYLGLRLCPLDWMFLHETRLRFEMERQDTSLHKAARTDSFYLAVYLIDSGASLNVQNHEGYTALCVAIEYGHENLANLLLLAGANPWIETDLGENAFDL